MLQSVVLEGGENYSFSFDIYLGNSFDKSKLSWGIFSIADNGYIGNIVCGYKEGTADPVVPISSVRQAVNSVYKNAELVEFDGEGHGFSKVKEAEARQLILDFIAKE